MIKIKNADLLLDNIKNVIIPKQYKNNLDVLIKSYADIDISTYFLIKNTANTIAGCYSNFSINQANQNSQSIEITTYEESFSIKIDYSSLQSILSFHSKYRIKTINILKTKINCHSDNGNISVNLINNEDTDFELADILKGYSIDKSTKDLKKSIFKKVTLDYQKDQIAFIDPVINKIITFNKSGSEIIVFNDSLLNIPYIGYNLFIEDLMDIYNFFDICNDSTKLCCTTSALITTDSTLNNFAIFVLPSNQSNIQYIKAYNTVKNLNLENYIIFDRIKFILTLESLLSYSKIEDSFTMKFSKAGNLIEFSNETVTLEFKNFMNSFSPSSNFEIEFGVSNRNIKNILKIIKNVIIDKEFSLYIGDTKKPVLYLKTDSIEILVGLEKSKNLKRIIEI